MTPVHASTRLFPTPVAVVATEVFSASAAARQALSTLHSCARSRLPSTNSCQSSALYSPRLPQQQPSAVSNPCLLQHALLRLLHASEALPPGEPSLQTFKCVSGVPVSPRQSVQQVAGLLLLQGMHGREEMRSVSALLLRSAALLYE